MRRFAAALIDAIPIVINWGYLQGKTGSTIGKYMLKIKVLNEKTSQPTGFNTKSAVMVSGSILFLTVLALVCQLTDGLGLGLRLNLK